MHSGLRVVIVWLRLLTQSGHCHRIDFRRFELAESMVGRSRIAAAGGNAIIRVAGVRMGLWP